VRGPNALLPRLLTFVFSGQRIPLLGWWLTFTLGRTYTEDATICHHRTTFAEEPVDREMLSWLKRLLDQLLHGFDQPATVPVVEPLRAVLKDVRDLQFVQQRLDRQMLIAEVAVAEMNESWPASEIRGP